MSNARYKWGGDMQVGDLVRYKDDGDIGIITEVYMPHGEFYVQWADGTEGYHVESEMEVLCK